MQGWTHHQRRPFPLAATDLGRRRPDRRHRRSTRKLDGDGEGGRSEEEKAREGKDVVMSEGSSFNEDTAEIVYRVTDYRVKSLIG